MVTQYYVAASLDGYIADENGSLDWLLDFGDADAVDPAFAQFLEQVGAGCMGASTYRWMVDNVLALDPTQELFAHGVPGWVIAHQRPPQLPDTVGWACGDITDIHAELARAAGEKNIWVMGGGELAGQFAGAGLLDELIVTFMPVVLGTGTPLLPRRLTRPLELTSTRALSGGAVQLTYRLG